MIYQGLSHLLVLCPLWFTFSPVLAQNPSVGCGVPSGLQASAVSSVEIHPEAAREGTHTIYLPSAYLGSSPLALVVGLHGWISDGVSDSKDAAFDKTAEEYGLITVWPDGVD